MEDSLKCCRVQSEIDPIEDGYTEPVEAKLNIGDRRWSAHGETAIKVRVIDISYINAEEADWFHLSEDEIIYVVEGGGGLFLVFEAELFKKRRDAEKIIQARISARALLKGRLNY